MDKGLTPYLLTIAPFIMFIGFALAPETDELRGQDYLDELAKAETGMFSIAIVLIVVGMVSIIGSFFLLSQDMMSSVGKMQQDMLMLARIAFIIPLVCFTIGIGAEAEMHWLLTEGEDDMTADEANAIALDLLTVAMHVWGAFPVGLGFALMLIGGAGLIGKDLSANRNDLVFGVPLVIGIGMFTVYWTNAWFFFMGSIFTGVPIGIMMLMGKLDSLYSKE